MSNNEWQQQVASFLEEAVRERNWDLRALSKEQRRELLWDLKQRGGFREQEAATFVGRLMGIEPSAVDQALK